MAKDIFSEDRGIVDDAFQNATDIDDAKTGVREDVKETIVNGGILLMADCPYCGLQWRGIIKWPEIMGFMLGRPVLNTQATPKGVGMVFGCKKCGRISPVTMTWDDVERYCAKGVKMGALPSDIYRARDQILAERAKQRQQQRR
jgi:hypothetical protein